MGVIKSQGIKQSLVVYLGVVFGAISWLFIYPNIDPSQLGLIKFIEGTAMLFIPFVLLGGNPLSVRYFPNFKDQKKGHNGFLFLLLSLFGIGFTLFLLLTFAFRESIYSYYGNQSTEFRNYLPYLVYIIPILFFMATANLLTLFTMNFKRIAIPAIFNDLFPKIGIPTLVLLFILNYLEWNNVMNGLLVVYGLVALGLILYLISLKQFHLRPRFEILNQKLIKEMGIYASYGVFGSLGTQLATRIDLFMVGSLINLTSTGIFAFSAYVGNVVEIPRRAISRIASPIIAQSINEGDTANVLKLYRKSALVQFIVGCFILGGIWLSIDDLFTLMANGEIYAQGKIVILLLAIAIIVDMLTGLNEEIIGYSPYFRYRFYLILGLAVFNTIANYFFIAIMGLGIVGAAIATLCSKTFYNAIKCLVLKIKMDMHPFSVRMLWVLAIVLVSYFATSFISIENTLFNILIKSIVFSVFYVSTIYIFRISKDVNEIINQVLKRVGLPQLR